MKRLHIRKASAGSGKTYQLACNFIRYSLGHRSADGKWKLNGPEAVNTHRHILAITFTNKATDEMKRRIVRELAILAEVPVMAGQKSDYEQELLQDFGLTGAEGTDKLRRAADRVLIDLLSDYGEFNVSTIDAFFQSVLRSFAFEADLSGNYEVTLDSDTLVENGIADTLLQAINGGPDSELMKWLESFMATSLRKGRSFNLLHRTGEMRSSIRKFIQALTDEDYQRHFDEINGFISRTNASAPNPVATLHCELRDLHESLLESIRSMAQSIASHPEAKGLKKTPLKAIVESIISGNEPSVTAALFNGKDNPDALFLQNAIPSAEFIDHCTSFIQHCIRFTTINEVLAQIYRFGIFDAINTNINRIKADNNTIFLSDTNSLLRRIISDSPSPFIYERTGLKLHHFLIDEFQDTSRMQWEILRPLLLESVAGGHDNLIIGDVKQCIYRFRNSDPHLLGHDLQADPSLSNYINEIHQGINYRSARQIVEFNYHLFPAIGIATGYSSVYPAETEPIRPAAPEGYVNIEALCPDSYKDNALRRMFDHICRQLSPEGGNYRPADIAVLARTNDEASEIIGYLMKELSTTPGMEGVQVLGDESLQLESSMAVRCIIAELGRRCAPPVPTSQKANPYARVSQTQLDWLATEFDRRRLETDANDPFETLSGLIAELDRRIEAESSNSETDKSAVPTSLPMLIEDLIAMLPPYLREKDSVYLYALMDVVTEFCQNGTASAHAFLQWWQLYGHKSCISTSDAANAIRVMTIHKAKGLEFDCVHIPYVEGSLGKETKIRWYNCEIGGTNVFRQLGVKGPVPSYFPLQSKSSLSTTLFGKQYTSLLAESRLDDINTLYVAFTRPIRELIVSVCGRKPPKNNSNESGSIEYQLRSALSLTRNNSGEWSYQSGVPTTRIATRKTEPDKPVQILMPGYTPRADMLSEILTEISDEI